MADRPFLSVVIPAYNEEDRLPATLARMQEYFEHERSEQYSYEILVVVDGSPDNTAGVAHRVAETYPAVRVIDRKENRGKGYTIQEGMEKARGEIRLFTDADNSTDIAQVEKLLPFFETGHKVVIGSRHASDSFVATPQPWYRTLLGRVGNIIIRIFAVPGIGDTQCGFKAFHHVAASKLFPLLSIEGFAFDIELLALARRYGYDIAEVGIRWVNDDRSTVKSSTFITVLIDVLRIRWRLWFGAYPRP